MKGFPELPLLRRELTELANRRRTYVVRVIGAVVVLSTVLVHYWSVMNARLAMMQRTQSLQVTDFLGIGGEILVAIAPVLFLIVTAIMPALACTSITLEKERHTIGTLLLTRLTPGVIVLEKYASRMIPMLTLILVACPVLAHVHSLGGVDTTLLVGTVWLLFLQCLLVASIAIFCSAWFSTALGSLICTYLIAGTIMIRAIGFGRSSTLPWAVWHRVFVDARFGPGVSPADLFIDGVPSIFFGILFLYLAKRVLVRRAFVSSTSRFLKLLKYLDAFFQRLNTVTGGIELVKDGDNFPENNPIAWRECSKKSLGKFRYLFRILVAIQVPITAVCLIAATDSAHRQFEGLYTLQAMVWPLCAMIVAAQGASLMSSERSRQTLEPLLATPISSAEIITQKMEAMKRLILVLAAPLLTINITHFLMQYGTPTSISTARLLAGPEVYLLLSFALTFVLLYLIAWFSAGIGLWIHSQLRAVLTAVVSIGVWIIVPFAVANLFPDNQVHSMAIVQISPASGLVFVEVMLHKLVYADANITLSPLLLALTVVASLIINSTLLFGIRYTVRNQASHLLNRRDNLIPQQRGAQVA